MENELSPLQKYKRSPKLYIDLPSKGNFYPKDALEGNGMEIEVYSMTASDEIKLKTPDALYTGKAIVSMIKRCVPAIKNPEGMPIIDLDYVLAAIRIASYGDTMNITAQCAKCKNEDTFGVEIQAILDHFTKSTFESDIRVEDFLLRLRPLSLIELTTVQQRTTAIQRQAVQYVEQIVDTDEKQAKLNALYDEINSLQTDVIYSIVAEITTPDGEKEIHHKFIVDFLENGDPKFFKAVKTAYDKFNESWAIPASTVACSECKTQYQIRPILDYANFFVNG
tara:strand:- start:1443 stop:2282 length:840 start_codon:yes stop_codon:yes gene_type:complete